jgi:hypothetical protein
MTGAVAAGDAAGATALGDATVGTVVALIGRCPERGRLLLVLFKLLHLPAATAAIISTPALTRPRLPEGECMPAPPPLPPSMLCGPWPKLSPRMLPQDCLLSSPLLARLDERL